MTTKYVISVSGGKDSTALLLEALSRCPREAVIPIFCDTGNEHVSTYAYLDYLEQALDIQIVRLKADFSEEIAAKRRFIARDVRTARKDGQRVRWTNKAKRRALEALKPTGNPFVDLCLWKGRFPSRLAQFCTQELKRNVAVLFQMDLTDQGYGVISWQGVRRDESVNRRKARKFERIGPRLWAFRPLVDWTAQQCFERHREAGIEPNPLYRLGMSRVGCLPCIHCGKAAIREIAARFPDEIERIAQMERLVSRASKRGFSTFFHKWTHAPGERCPDIFAMENVQAIVEWSHTRRGGRQLDLLAPNPEMCASAYGLCE
ncbi:hypothetical protein FACS1894158_17810 [Betaproteobacteria bacterium]|nr:hypothetical protein FACS1894158_17810 [Betaproteobacteria bacterium]